MLWSLAFLTRFRLREIAGRWLSRSLPCGSSFPSFFNARLVTVALCSLTIHCGNGQTVTTDAKPNILFVAVDDMNDWVSFLGGHPGMKIHTPNLDRLAASSMIFTNAHTAAPACAPTRTAILTGVHHTRSGAEHVHWGDGPKWREFEALKDVETLEQFFKNRGYKTLGAGKIYHSQAPPWTPTSQVEPANWDFYYPSGYISHLGKDRRGCP